MDRLLIKFIFKSLSRIEWQICKNVRLNTEINLSHVMHKNVLSKIRVYLDTK